MKSLIPLIPLAILAFLGVCFARRINKFIVSKLETMDDKKVATIIYCVVTVALIPICATLVLMVQN